MLNFYDRKTVNYFKLRQFLYYYYVYLIHCIFARNTLFLVQGGLLVDVIRGANSPQLQKKMIYQLAYEHKVLEGLAERKEVGFSLAQAIFILLPK